MPVHVDKFICELCFPSPFLSRDVHPHGDGAVDVGLYHRAEVLQDQLHCATADGDVPAKRPILSSTRRQQDEHEGDGATYISYLLWRRSPMGGRSAVQRSRFQIEGRSVMTESRSLRTAWSLYDTAWSTAAIFQAEVLHKCTSVTPP